MAKKRKLNVFSDEFVFKLLESIDEDGLRDVFQSIETLISNDNLIYRKLPGGKEFGLNIDLKEETNLTIPSVEKHKQKDTIYALMRFIIRYVEGNGEEQIESLLDRTDVSSTENLQNNLILFVNLVSKSDTVLNFIIYGSFSRSNKLENYSYNINLDSLIIKENNKNRLIQTPIGYLTLTYFNPKRGKTNVIDFSISKRLLKKFKKDINKFYDEFEVYENFAKQKSNKEIKEKEEL